MRTVYDRPVRRQGAYERFRQLTAEDDAYNAGRPQWAFRVALCRFVTVAARQYYQDLALTSALDRLNDAYHHLGDPTQRRTHSDFECRGVRTLEHLHSVVEDFTEHCPDATPLDQDDALIQPFYAVPAELLLGEHGPGSSFDLICWNAANCALEGIRRPYWAARPIVHAAYHRPTDTYGLVQPLTALTERYEDHPDERPAVAEEITAVLTRFLEIAPWPLDRAG